MPRITIIHEDDDAVSVNEDMSAARVLFANNHEPVPLQVEMDLPEGWEYFNKLPDHVLPPLSPGYEWTRVNNKYCIIREIDAKVDDLLLIIYGPDQVTHKINFIFRINNRTTYSFAHTKNGHGPGKRNYPMYTSGYRVPGFDYSGHRYGSHVRGHLVDHEDTILNANTRDLWSTEDPRNYVPEPPDYEWGLGFRNQKVKKLRQQRGGSAYAQLNVYPRRPLLTSNGTPVPEDVKFIAYSIDPQRNYTADEAFDVEFDEDLTRRAGVKVLDHADANFAMDVRACPIVKPYSPQLSDRALRLQARDAFFKVAKIQDGNISSRFPERDALFASCDAANHEFETAGRHLGAGVRLFDAGRQGEGKSYARISLHLACQLSELDDAVVVPYTRGDEAVARQLFKNLDDDEMLDHFNGFQIK